MLTLIENGDIHTWGNNDSGQLGLGHCKTPQPSASKIQQRIEDVVAVYGGGHHSMALTSMFHILLLIDMM